jgi:subtilisin family serine protease
MPIQQTNAPLLIRTRGDSALESTGGGEPTAWVVGTAPQGDRQTLHPWDQAHGVLDVPSAIGLESAAAVDYVEPDFVQTFPYQTPEPDSLESALERADACPHRAVDVVWPNPPGRFGWHLDDDYTQLRAARDAVGDPGDAARILVGILDTGYDPEHISLPRHVRYDFAVNLSGDGPTNNATDPGSAWPMTNPGHGTATLALLAGNRILRSDPAFDDFLGGAPYASIVPIRIAESVIHFRTSSMAKGLEYAASIGCQVVSISMGGVPTQRWADAVNQAYRQGMCIFAAAGNRIGPSPPATLVYPARFGRVVAVCGFTSDKTPYYLDGWHRQMHGCFGPASAMTTALTAFTPNTPWAGMGCGTLVNPDGAGTSSATPQCAAAAALWLQKHRPNPAEKWRIVEAVRHALFSTADKSPAAGADYFGNGLLRAFDALGVGYRGDLLMTPADEVSFPWLRLAGALEHVNETEEARQKMYETEALQLFLQSPKLQRITGNADPQSMDLDQATLKKLIDAIRTMPSASRTLRTHLDVVRTRL